MPILAHGQYLYGKHLRGVPLFVLFFLITHLREKCDKQQVSVAPQKLSFYAFSLKRNENDLQRNYNYAVAGVCSKFSSFIFTHRAKYMIPLHFHCIQNLIIVKGFI